MRKLRVFGKRLNNWVRDVGMNFSFFLSDVSDWGKDRFCSDRMFDFFDWLDCDLGARIYLFFYQGSEAEKMDAFELTFGDEPEDIGKYNLVQQAIIIANRLIVPFLLVAVFGFGCAHHVHQSSAVVDSVDVVDIVDDDGGICGSGHNCFWFTEPEALPHWFGAYGDCLKLGLSDAQARAIAHSRFSRLVHFNCKRSVGGKHATVTF